MINLDSFLRGKKIIDIIPVDKLPHVRVNEDNDLLFEWWNGVKKLSLYIEPSCIRYVKSWGCDMETEMEAGTFEINDGFLLAWDWLWWGRK